jgi:hypothetical protein
MSPGWLHNRSFFGKNNTPLQVLARKPWAAAQHVD